MTVKEIVIKYLVNNGYDGLCTDDCGCGIHDLNPCGECMCDCVPAKKVLKNIDGLLVETYEEFTQQ